MERQTESVADRYKHLQRKTLHLTGIAPRSHAEQIVAATQGDPNRLYVLEVASEGEKKGKNKQGEEITVVHDWGVTHMALLYNGTVYHCTTHQPSSACIDKPIDEFMKHRRRVYLFEPPPC
jgi:hypothetical protein